MTRLGHRREIEDVVRERARRHPSITITGPRQSGKTTLCRLAFPDHEWCNLEDPALREQAAADPNGFLARFRGGVLLDEVQRVPILLSALQNAIDREPLPGRFVLSGSHSFELGAAIAQSLAGRTTVLDLLPMTCGELRQFADARRELLPTMLAGGFPRIFDWHLPPAEFHADYVRTYLERDVRSVLRVKDLGAFQVFLRLCAGRSATLLNFTALANDCGITHPTAREWTSVLEASFLVRRIAPWFRNLGKRMVKTPKLHLLDSGLLCWLLGIRTADQLDTHPLRGQVFESWVVAELLKLRANRGCAEPMWFLRDKVGNEVDLLLDLPDRTVLVECKSGTRVAPDGLTALDRAQAFLEQDPLLRRPIERVVVYGGDEQVRMRDTDLVPWHSLASRSWV